MGRVKGSKNKKQTVTKRSASKLSSDVRKVVKKAVYPSKPVAPKVAEKPAKKVASKPLKPAKLVKSTKRIPKSVKVVEKDLPDRKPPKKVTESGLTQEDIARMIAEKGLRFDEPACYVCGKLIKYPWEEASVDKANNVYRHHRCAYELVRRWYASMGLVYEPKAPSERKEKDLVIDED